MNTSLEVIQHRQAEIVGYAVELADLELLAGVLGQTLLAPLVDIFRHPVSGMIVAFVVDAQGRAHAPGPAFMQEYDPETEQELLVCHPRNIVRDIQSAYTGRMVFDAGFVPFADPTIGGDSYYLRADKAEPMRWGVYRVYDDWVKPEDPVPVPPQAIHLVANSFAEVLQVAQFTRGPTPVEWWR